MVLESLAQGLAGAAYIEQIRVVGGAQCVDFAFGIIHHCMVFYGFIWFLYASPLNPFLDNV